MKGPQRRPAALSRARRALALIADIRGLRRVWRHHPRALVCAHAALGAFAVRPSLRLLLRWMARRPPASYRLRSSGGSIRVRHSLGDVWVLDEVFNRGVYTPPLEVERALAGLDGGLRMVDLGAHVGAVSLHYLDRFPGSRPVAFEPNADSRRLLETNLADNRLGDRAKVVGAAAGVTNAAVKMSGASVLAHVVHQELERPRHLDAFAGEFGGVDEVEVSMVDVLPRLAGADLLKMDIEGGEWEILADGRFARAGLTAVVLEFHELGAPGPDAGAAAAMLLEAAGFTVGQPFDERNGEGVLWAYRAPSPG